MTRLLWNGLGFLFLGIGIVGYVTPVLPGTVFMIIALSCFIKGANERQVQWILNHPWFGHILRDWSENKWISARVKWIASACIVIFSGLSIAMLYPKWSSEPRLIVIPASITVLAVIGVTYIVTRRTKPAKGSPSGSPANEVFINEPPREVFAPPLGQSDTGRGDRLSGAVGESEGERGSSVEEIDAVVPATQR